MSGGQKQRVMIAMALSCNPQLLIADEPTTALDVTIQAQILDILRKLRDNRGMAIIFITHDLGVIAEIADDVLVMFRGKEVEYGPVLDIFAKPKHPYTKGLLACRPRLESKYPPPADRRRLHGNASREDGDSPRHRKEDGRRAAQAPRNAGPRPAAASEVRTRRDRPSVGRRPPRPRHANRRRRHRSRCLRVENLQVYFPVRRGILARVGRPRQAPSTTSASTSTAAKRSASSANRAAAKRPPAAPSCGSSNRPPAASLYNGIDLAPARRRASSARMRGKMQIIFQDPYGSLNPRMTIESAHHRADGHPAHRHAAAPTAATGPPQLLERSRPASPAYLRRYPHEFSGGQRQRICIARALAAGPEFIICDDYFFDHSDRRPDEYLSGYFDTTTGPKNDPASYAKIALAFGVPASEIAFISDVTRELDAAREAGMQTLLCVRSGNPVQSPHTHRVITTFTEIDTSN